MTLGDILAVDFAGRDNARDRELGAQWERNFCSLAAQFEKSFTPHQIGRESPAACYKQTPNGIHPTLLPDVTVWTAPGEHHEIKHKKPGGKREDSWREYGLEKYRLDALLAFQDETQQTVLYTIHDWELAGAAASRDVMPNRIEDWRTVDVLELEQYVIHKKPELVPFPTWVNGQRAYRQGYWWPVTLWQPLDDWWNLPY